MRAGEGDKIFGSVTAANISQQLTDLGFELGKKSVHLPEPIKSLGTFTVPVKLHAEVQVDVTVQVEREE